MEKGIKIQVSSYKTSRVGSRRWNESVYTCTNPKSPSALLAIAGGYSGNPPILKQMPASGKMNCTQISTDCIDHLSTCCKRSLAPRWLHLWAESHCWSPGLLCCFRYHGICSPGAGPEELSLQVLSSNMPPLWAAVMFRQTNPILDSLIPQAFRISEKKINIYWHNCKLCVHKVKAGMFNLFSDTYSVNTSVWPSSSWLSLQAGWEK